jgi:hypothetical protein
VNGIREFLGRHHAFESDTKIGLEQGLGHQLGIERAVLQRRMRKARSGWLAEARSIGAP